MDHLTTRMRRHAEGLIILSGAPPGRSWSAPVKLVDVMRGAVAEVEDYARVNAATQSRAALAGSAVTDVIHLLAELIENATTLSPPFTQVRVSGETVANGFAIEIEDRGLGMVPQRMQELNERLANPPDLNPANTEQLGLFVVGQLARRHGIRVMLRPSPYGGTTAVVLIPLALIVEDGPAAITSGPRAPETAGANGSYRANGSANGSYASGGYPASPAAGGSRGPARTGGSGMPSRSMAPVYNGGTGSSRTGYQSPGSPGPREAAADARNYGAGTQDQDRSATRVTGALPLRHPNSAGTGAPGSFGASGYDTGPNTSLNTGLNPGTRATPGGTEPGGRRGGRHGTDDVPVVTGVPVGRPVTVPEPEFDVFTPIRRPEQDGPAPVDAAQPQPYPDFGGEAAGGYVSPYSEAPGASAYQGDGGAYQGNGTAEATRAPQENGSYGNEAAFGNDGISDDSYQDGESASGDFKGLPRRVRQANLAPQLRASAAAAADSQGPAGVPPATAASLTDMRNTLSAMQRGWQQGRSQTQRDAED
jgi:hypothetical protein